MNSVFSVDDLSEQVWAAAESMAVAEKGLGMTRSQSEWAFQRFLEEMAASGNPISSSSEAENPIHKTSMLHSQSSVSRPEDVDRGHVIEIQKPQPLDYNPNHLRHSDDNGSLVQKPKIHERINDNLHSTDDKGNRNHALPSAPTRLPIDSDQYRAILKSKLDLACAAAVALRAANVKPELSGASANHQKQPEISGSRAQGSPVTQTSPSASSASIPTVTTSHRKTDALVRQTSGSSRDDSDDEDFEGDTDTTDNLDPADIKRARRMLSNRESARRSRRRKQEQMNELETQAGQLRVEHSSLLKRLSDMNHKYDTAAVDNRILKADIETLRTKVKMAEDTVKRMTGTNPLLMARPTMPNAGMHLENVPADSTRVSAVPSANHILKSAGPNILPREPITRVHNSFSSSGLVRPTNLARNSRVENLTKNPQHVVSADILQKQVTNSGTQDYAGSGAKTSEMSGRIQEVAENNQQQR